MDLLANNLQANTDSYIAEVPTNPSYTTIIFTLKQESGALAETLNIFKERNISLFHIESRPSKIEKGCYEILIEFAEKFEKVKIEEIINLIKQKTKTIHVYDFNSQIKQNKESFPWFPVKKIDIDQFANRVLNCGVELNADHPGFKDEQYRKRRKIFADIAANFKHNDEIPRIEYTKQEIETWRTVYNELTKLYPTHACKEFNYIFPLLQQNCGYGPDNIPQLQDVSDFLKSCTGFTLRPVAGLLSSRDFLAGLAFRVFHSTQYIRHHNVPNYTPEPDICHELLGHAPLFADRSFAEFSQEIGLASLGASDEMIEKLATLYWFTVEYGICIQSGKKKAFGAGLLSSFGELQYCLTNEPEIIFFEPSIAAITKFPITTFQPKYFVAESFEEAKIKLTTWASTIPKPFQVRYNPYTERVDILDNMPAVQALVKDVKLQISKLEDALQKMELSLNYK